MKTITLLIVGLSVLLFYVNATHDELFVGIKFIETICLSYYKLVTIDYRFVVHISKSGRKKCKHNRRISVFTFSGDIGNIRKLKRYISPGQCSKCGSTNISYWCNCSKDMLDKNKNTVDVEGVRIKCNTCNKTTRCYPCGIKLWERLLPETYCHLVMQKMYKRSGYRVVGQEDYTSKGFSASTCWKAVQKMGDEAEKAMKEVPKEWSNIIIVDEKYEKCNGGTIIYIVASHFFKDKDGHHYSFIIKTRSIYVKATEESKKDKRKLNAQVRDELTKEIPKFFQELADSMDKPNDIKAFVTDLENLYPGAISKAFPKAKHQFCLEHVFDAAKRAFKRDLGVKSLTKEDHALLDVISEIPKIKSREDYLQIGIEFQKWWDNNKERLRGAREKKGRTRGGIEWWYRNVLLKEENICAFLAVPGCPCTTNSLESMFSRLDQRTLEMKSFQSGDGAERYLTLAAVYLNVAPFLDGHNKGSSVIELAGVEWKQNIFP